MSKVIYDNPLACENDIKDFVLEGEADISFDGGALSIRGKSEAGSDRLNFWCPKSFPSDVKIEWEFRPIKEPGTAQLFFAAKEKDDKRDFFELSFYKRAEDTDRSFHLCDLKKSFDEGAVAQAADPLPEAKEDLPWYSMCIVKNRNKVVYAVNDFVVLEFEDDGMTHGDILTGGCVGFGQREGLLAQYRNFRVTWV